MTNRYSRLESTEEKRNFRNAILLLVLSILVIILLFVYGIPLVGRVASFVSGLKNGGGTITSNDKTPPVPPNFNIYPDYTNQQTISISGSAEPGVSIILVFNDKKSETLVDKDGNFVFQGLTLEPEANTFSATASDLAGNLSQSTEMRTINYDSKPPELVIDSPQDDAGFYGNTQRQISIQGTAENNVAITINDRVVTVDENGKFQYPVTLNSGANTFNIKVTDLAGNQTEKNISLNFSD